MALSRFVFETSISTTSSYRPGQRNSKNNLGSLPPARRKKGNVGNRQKITSGENLSLSKNLTFLFP